MAWINPKLDWLTNPVNPTAADLNRIEGDIAFLNSDITTKKGAIVNALVSVGIATLLTDTHAAIATKITTAEKTGVSITPSTVNQAIPKGIYDTGGGTVLGDIDLKANNIRQGITMFGILGTLIEGARYATGTFGIQTGDYIVSGLGFTPNLVVIYSEQTDVSHSGYFAILTDALKIMHNGVLYRGLYGYAVNGTTVNYLSANGFTAPVPSGKLHRWYAFII